MRTGEGRRRLDALAELALTALPQMRDTRSGLFSHKAVPHANGFRNIGANPLYSAISAIGILRDGSLAGETAVAQLGKTLGELRRVAGAASGSQLGATLWAHALAEDGAGVDALVQAVSTRFDPARASSMDIGLMLSGLAAAAERVPAERDQAARLAVVSRDELLRRFASRARVFAASARVRRPRTIMNRNVTTFASQVYPIHGLTEQARVFGAPLPYEAVTAAEHIIERQGEFGQWWWFYSVRTGEVLEGYPVYSVHQDGMAFMALAALQNIGAGAYDESLWLGLEWVFGRNELGLTLVDDKRGLIYRCIQRKGSDEDAFGGISRANHARVALSSFGLARASGAEVAAGDIELLRECRSYHLGWLLYARSLVRSWPL